ncbi:MAG: cyclic pyranopterin monophosphate synthase MoaC [Candidatus Aminicenantes bacterium]|nr:cyclic pyranopterin monophosphate synthase MoaC [Candidatus Aminicenantes bacterium]
MKLSHVTQDGKAEMVDVSKKTIVRREAVASGKIYLQQGTVDLIKKNRIQKGDVLSTARIAAVQGAKRTSELIPLCHNITLDHIQVMLDITNDGVDIKSRVVCIGRTGAEMEALTAISIAALTIYDMCKAVDKTMKISEISLKEKSKNEI